ncbi:hypothetical protein FPV67DRAFT_1511653 [Lyophyllum atratum]|nr:hypothetical protein FPV67DRAFT_1511653 [Lyophyllum atratum]
MKILLLGVFICLFSRSASILVSRGLALRPTRIMFTITLASFVLVTMYWVSRVGGYAMQIKEILVNSFGTLDDAKVARADQKGEALALVGNWAAQLLLIISDCTVIWRAWVLYPERRWIMIAPCALLVGTIGTSLACLVLLFTESAHTFGGLQTSPRIAYVFDASLALSLATNAVSTLLILYKLWAHFRLFGPSMGITRNSTSPVLRVMLVLVESGFAYCSLQAMLLILEFIPITDFPLYTVDLFLISSSQMITAMYPVIIVVVVSHKRSMVETFGLSLTELKHPGAADIVLASPASAAHGSPSSSVF